MDPSTKWLAVHVITVHDQKPMLNQWGIVKRKSRNTPYYNSENLKAAAQQ